MNRPIEIAGIGRTRSAEKWNLGLIDLAVKAASEALKDARNQIPDAIVVGNALGGALSDQRNLGAYVASGLGLNGIEVHSVAADEASGGAAFRLGLALIEAGWCRSVLVIGAEKTSDALPDQLEAVRSTGLDAIQEAEFGFGPTIAAALGMQRYIDTWGIDRAQFFYLAETAHFHGAHNPLAIFPWSLTMAQYLKSPVVASPLTVCDNAPPCDGGAAVLLRACSPDATGVRVLSSTLVSSATGIAIPIQSLNLEAARASAEGALRAAALRIDDISLFDLHDTNAFLAVLSIEAAGLAKPGKALERARNGDFHFDGSAPMWTFGGLKSRGIAPGAAGVFQIAEASLQLRGEGGKCQVASAKTALVQCLGSFGAMAVTHVLGV